MEPRFGAGFGDVRIHTGDRAARLSARLGAQAFTVGSQVFFARGQFRPDTRDGRQLIAHELTHTIQQGSVVQRSAGPEVTQRTAPQVQRLGIGDALNYFADRANAIPGFRMFTIILGVNPINMTRVERSAANILRAIVEFLPGGNLITQALDNHGVFDRVGAWIEQQIATLGMTGSVIRDAIDRFLDSLSWRDIFDLGGVWRRATRIFTDPIDRILSFGRGLVTGILRFIKEAILRPLARLAEGTRGYDLLKAVLGQDPVTGDPVPRNAQTLIGGFMRLIGQEEIWQNIQRANAIPRAWAWFQNALGGLLGLVRQIPQRFLDAFRSLEIMDIVLVPRAFARIASVFAGFIGEFLSWAGNTVWDLLQIIFEVVAPSVMVYLRRAASAFRTILRDPIGFVGNLVRAGAQGLRQFGRNFLTHLRGALIGWLTGAMSGASIYIPQGFNLREILKFVLSVLGLTWQNIRRKLVRAIGETAVGAMETTFDIVVTLVRDGPAAAWQRILESLTNLRDLVIEQVMTFVRDRVVVAAITRLASMLSPVGAFVQAIIGIYNTVMFFVERLRQIAQVAASFIDAISAIANGVIQAAADRVERTMAGLLTLVISFLARIAGLGRVSDAVTNVINRVRQPIDRGLDRVVDWIVAQARRLGRFVAQAGVPQDPNERLRLGRAAALAAVNRFARRPVARPVLTALLRAIQVRYGFTRLDVVPAGGRWRVAGELNPRFEAPTESLLPGSEPAGDPQTPEQRSARVKARVREEMQRRRTFSRVSDADAFIGSVFSRYRAEGLQYLKIARGQGELSVRMAASAEEEASKAELETTFRIDDLDLTRQSTTLIAVVNGNNIGRIESIPHGEHAEELLINRLTGDQTWRRDAGGPPRAGGEQAAPAQNHIDIDITRTPCGRSLRDCGTKLIRFASRTNSRLTIRAASFYAGSGGRHAQASRGSLDRLFQSKNVTLQVMDVLSELQRHGINSDEVSPTVRTQLEERVARLREEFQRLERIFKR